MYNFGFVLLFSLVAILCIGLNKAGVQYENDRLYEKCLVEKQEMVYNKAVEYCKERVK
jgi:hypothetical protein